MTSNYQGYGIHAAMLHTGKVLMWGYPIHVEQQDAWRGNESYAWLWDPSKGYGSDAVEDVTPVIGGENVSIYCSGMSFLADGRLLLVGGTLTWGVNDPDFPTYTEFAGLNRALLFDPATETWTEMPRPSGSHGRWYPTQMLLPDGRTFVISGLSDVSPGGVLNDTLEIYDANGGSPTLLDSAVSAAGHRALSAHLHDAGRRAPDGRAEPGRLRALRSRRTSPIHGRTCRTCPASASAGTPSCCRRGRRARRGSRRSAAAPTARFRWRPTR